MEAILTHFGEVLGSKIIPKVAQKVTRNQTEKYTKNVPSFDFKMKPKTAPRRPKTAPRQPKTAPRQRQDDPRQPQDCLKTASRRAETARNPTFPFVFVAFPSLLRVIVSFLRCRLFHGSCFTMYLHMCHIKSSTCLVMYLFFVQEPSRARPLLWSSCPPPKGRPGARRSQGARARWSKNWSHFWFPLWT